MNTDYPRMLFHRTKDPVTVQTREQEDALGPEWSRRIWPADAPDAEPEPEPDPEPEDAPEPDPEEETPATPRRRPGRPPGPAKTAHKKR